MKHSNGWFLTSMMCNYDCETKETMIPFIDYLNTVDDLLEARGSAVSSCNEVGAVAGCQDAGWTSKHCATWLDNRRKSGKRGTLKCT